MTRNDLREKYGIWDICKNPKYSEFYVECLEDYIIKLEAQIEDWKDDALDKDYY